MPFKRLFKDKYAGSLPENASVVRTLFDLFFFVMTMSNIKFKQEPESAMKSENLQVCRSVAKFVIQRVIVSILSARA